MAGFARTIAAAALAMGLCGSVAWAEAPALPTGAHASASALGQGFSDGYATVRGVRLHYVIGGKGLPVVLVPGWPETWWAWRHVLPELAQRFTVVALDTRGMGESSRPLTGYDSASLGADVVELMARLGHRRFRYVGHDIGVWIGYAVAADRPDAIERLVLIDSNLPGVSPVMDVFQPKEVNTRAWHFMFNQLDDLPELLVQGRERQFLEWIYGNYGYRPGSVAVDAYVRAYAMPGAMRAGFAYYRALPETIEQNRRRMHARLTMPILTVGGEFGTADMAERTLRPFADDLKGVVLPSCGHYVPEECPAALAERIVPFLAGTPP